MGIELHHPVPHDLKRHAADLRRLCARRPVVNRSQQPIVGAPGRCPSSSLASRRSSTVIKVSSKWDRHRKPPSFATPKQIIADSRIPLRVRINGSWYDRMIREGRLEAVQIGRRVMVKIESAERLFARN